MTTITKPQDHTWPTRGACRTNPDLWHSTYSADRALAVHTCLTHCPVLDNCALRAALIPCAHSVQAGILYDDNIDTQPAAKQPSRNHVTCKTCALTATADIARPTADRTPPTVGGKCGTPAGYRLHARHGEDQCEPCREANRDRKRQQRAAVRGAACGTLAGAKRHGLDGTRLCTPCRQVEARTDGLKTSRPERSSATVAYVDDIREYAALAWSDKKIGVRLGISDDKVRRIRAANDIPSLVASGGYRPRGSRVDEVAA